MRHGVSRHIRRPAEGAQDAQAWPLVVACYAFALAVLGLGAAQHARADLMLHPTRVVFERNTRSAQIDLINRGAETAIYRITLVNRRMDEVGQFSEADVPQPGEAFADKLVRYSPRQVTLAPGAGQTVRILLSKPPDLPAGEYRSHLLFQRVAEQPRADKAGAPTTDLEITLRALVSVSVPVIVRHGETSATAEIGELGLRRGASGEPLAAIELRRSGNRSVFGDLVVSFTPPGGAEVVVGRANGVAVYAPNPVRRAQLGLQPPAGVDLARGTLRARFRERPEEGGKILAERTIQLP